MYELLLFLNCKQFFFAIALYEILANNDNA